jgi:translation initiation factor IF-2
MIIKKPPVVAVMGHIDHGKSTLLSYIRNSQKEIQNEAGGITQHISAYEVTNIKNHPNESITFLDTPGHEAFNGIRKRGAKTADIAILVVSAEDGVKPQTVEAIKMIKESNTNFIVAISKIDKPEANIERVKMSLAEHEVFVEGYGGTVSFVPISAKTGEGVEALLEMILLTADLEDLKYDDQKLAEGVIIEAKKDPKKGICAVCIIKDGKIKSGQFVVSGRAYSPVRIMENYLGKNIKEAVAGTPINIIGFDELPKVGEIFKVFDDKKIAEQYRTEKQNEKSFDNNVKSLVTVPVIIKADTGGTLEALAYEINKLNNETVGVNIISKGIGNITEADIKNANGDEKAIIIGFGVKADGQISLLAERSGISINIFNIIYKISEWLKEELLKRAPKNEEVQIKGIAKILKTFSRVKDRQIVGGVVESGELKVGNNIEIKRREEVISYGKIKNLQSKKVEVDIIEEGKEFGAMIESKIEIAVGDRIIYKS